MAMQQTTSAPPHPDKKALLYLAADAKGKQHAEEEYGPDLSKGQTGNGFWVHHEH